MAKFNKTLLLRVREKILANPQRVDMNDYLYDSGESCGTVGCIAGWTAMCSRAIRVTRNEDEVVYKGKTTFCYEAAREALGITMDEAMALFLNLTEFDHLEQGTCEYVRAVAQRIDKFISMKEGHGRV